MTTKIGMRMGIMSGYLSDLGHRAIHQIFDMGADGLNLIMIQVSGLESTGGHFKPGLVQVIDRVRADGECGFGIGPLFVLVDDDFSMRVLGVVDGIFEMRSQTVHFEQSGMTVFRDTRMHPEVKHHQTDFFYGAYFPAP